MAKVAFACCIANREPSMPASIISLWRILD
jgi:hypothetical protein